MPKPKKVIILISGNGSNLQAIIDYFKIQQLKHSIVAVISSAKEAYGLQRAKQAQIPAYIFTLKDYTDRHSCDQALMQKIEEYQPDLIVLAGYMRILTSDFVRHYQNKIINIHPSLLPKYPGLHTHRKVLEQGETEHGTTIHFVTEDLDQGPIILQVKIHILPYEDEQDLRQRIQTQEHQIYPMVIHWYLEEKLSLYDNKVWFNNVPLPSTGLPIVNLKSRVS